MGDVGADYQWRPNEPRHGAKPWLVVLAIVLAVVAAAYFYLRDGYVYQISETELQSRMEGQFPVNKCVLIFCIELDDPFVRLIDQRARIEFGSRAVMELAFSDRQYIGHAGFSGVLKYVPGTGEFYLRDPKLEYLEVTGVSEEHKRDLHKLAGMLVSDYLSGNPVYSFKDTMFDWIAPWLELKSIKVRNDTLRLWFGLAV